MKKLRIKEARRQRRNSSVQNLAKGQLRQAQELVDSKQPAEEAIKEAISTLDKAARKGIIHPNNTSRHKSRLMKRLHQARSGSASS